MFYVLSSEPTATKIAHIGYGLSLRQLRLLLTEARVLQVSGVSLAVHGYLLMTQSMTALILRFFCRPSGVLL